MINLRTGDKIDSELYYELLTTKTEIFLDDAKLKSSVNFLTNRKFTLARLVLMFMRVYASKYASVLNADSVYDFLTSELNISPSVFSSKKVQRGWSIDQSKLEKIKDNPNAADFVELYSTYTSTKSRSGLLDGILTRSSLAEEKGPNGEALRRVRFSVSPSPNLRFVTKNENVIQIPKELSSSITVPKGYFLAWGDFASADMIAALNLFLIDNEEDLEVARQHPKDGYAIFAHLLSKFYGEEFDQEEFMENRPLYKLYALKTIYGNQHGSSQEENDFIKRARPFLFSKPRYKRYLDNLKRAYQLQIPLEIESYFGFKSYLDRYAGNSSEQEMIDKALNTPVQTNTSERIISLVNTVCSQFEGLGYKNGEDFRVYFVRHDEPLFMFKDEMVKDMWVLEDNSAIQVDDGIVQYCDWFFGRFYTQPLDSLKEEVKKSVEANIHRFTKLEPRKRETTYRPIRDISEIGVAFTDMGSDLVVTLYLADTNTVSYKKYENMASPDAKVATDILQGLFLEHCKLDRLGDVGSILVYNEHLDDALFRDDVFIKFSKLESKSLNKARDLGGFVCKRIAQRDGLDDSRYREPDPRYVEELKKVGASDVF